MTKLDKIGSVTSDSVKKYTKHDWTYWIQTLNQLLCQSYSHQELVHLLKTKFKLPPWWQQEVARGYQIAIGIRRPQQTLKGTYTTTVTKSFKLNSKSIFSFLISAKGQHLWLNPLYPLKINVKQAYECEGGIFGEFRTVGLNKNLRLTWIDEDWPHKSTVQIQLYPKPEKKCMLVINHTDLPTLKAKIQMHAYWRQAIDAIGNHLEKISS